MNRKINVCLMLASMILFVNAMSGYGSNKELQINDHEYFETQGLNIMVFHDDYPEGHQGGITIIQNGVRIATNGDLRLEPAPGQWQPVPKVGERSVDRKMKTVSVKCVYPHPDKNRKGFNPIDYPDLKLSYTVNVRAQGRAFIISVDLDEALPEGWVGKVGFNLELFPGDLFGKTYNIDDEVGFFPRQLNGPMINDGLNGLSSQSLAKGRNLVIAPESESQRLSIEALKGRLELIDGRGIHNNGWFIVRTPIPSGETDAAIEWLVTPNIIPNWMYDPVVHVSQVGYLPAQKKIAVIEIDKHDKDTVHVQLKKIMADGVLKTVKSEIATNWGEFYRYRYFHFDFTDITEDGMYLVTYDDVESNPFMISEHVLKRHVWQPILEYFLPVQMCHMRINDRYRVWHGLCHMDDALMAPTNTHHFDGYRQGDSTLTSFKPYERVPGLNVGGWHDAGDYDLRVESQAETVRMLALAYEEFKIDYDVTTVDQENHIVEMHRPDGVPDVMQQIEHGVLSILAGYRSFGRLHRGIICSDLRQYVLLGDGSTMTDNKAYEGENVSEMADDRWVFVDGNPYRELFVTACLSAASRVLSSYDQQLADECLKVAEDVWDRNHEVKEFYGIKLNALSELILSTEETRYKETMLDMKKQIKKNIRFAGWAIGRALTKMNNEKFSNFVTKQVREFQKETAENCEKTPFGVPYEPRIWGHGWEVQSFGIKQYYLHKKFPDIVSSDYMLNALNFVLGCHPGPNTASFASGIGVNSLEVAYGVNRAEWSFIPGGVASGTGLIRPDFFELKEWPFFWQQTEYMINGAATNFMFLVLGAKEIAASK